MSIPLVFGKNVEFSTHEHLEGHFNVIFSASWVPFFTTESTEDSLEDLLWPDLFWLPSPCLLYLVAIEQADGALGFFGQSWIVGHHGYGCFFLRVQTP